MLPRLAPRRDSRRRSSTLFPPPIPSTTSVAQLLRPQRTVRNVRGEENNINENERQCHSDKSGMDLLANAVINCSRLPSVSSSPSTQPVPSIDATAPWSPPRSTTKTTIRKDHSNLNVASTEKSSTVLPKNEECTTPTNMTQEFHDFPKLPYYLSSSSSSSSSSGSSTYHCFEDASLSLTPPASAPAPLLVSAKRLGTEVRSLHSKRRKASWIGYMSSTEHAKSDDEDSQPMVYTDQLHSPAYGRKKGPVRIFGRWKKPNHNEGDEGDSVAIDDPYYGLTSPPSNDDDDDDEPYLLPPFLHNLSPQEQKRRYWQLCYGSDPPLVVATTPNPSAANLSVGEVSWSASRAPPTKSCLSSAKKASFLVPSTSTPEPAKDECWTPKASPEETIPGGRNTAASHNRKTVQFGSPKAAEYEIGAPSGAMTPLPAEVARARFPVDDPDEHPRNQEDHDLELELIRQTKINTQVLQGWETSFDDFDPDEYEQDEDEEDDPHEAYHPQNHRNTTRPTPIGFSLPPMDDGNEEFDAKARQKRRNSGFFSQSDVSALLSSSDSDEDEITAEDNEVTRVTADEPDEDDSIACHIATLCVTTTTTKPASTPISVTAEPILGRNENVIAAETTPPSHSDEAPTEITPPSTIKTDAMASTPPSDISYSSMHSSGAAFFKSDASPTLNAQPALEGRALKYGVDVESSQFEDPTPIDILETLRKNPATAQEWETTSLLLTLARYGNRSFRHDGESDRVASLLAFAAVNPEYIRIVQIGVAAFVSRLDDHLSTKLPATTPVSNVTERGRVLQGDQEWIRMESAFWQQVNVDMDDMETELTILSRGIDCSEVPEVRLNDPRLRRRTMKRETNRLEKSLQELQKAIAEASRSKALMKAKLRRLQTRRDLERAMPFSVLTFRVTAAVLSFRMVGCAEDIAVWRMDHVVDGTETEVTWNMETGSFCWYLIAVDDDSSFVQPNKVPRDHVASQLHQILVVRCMEECHQFLQNDEDGATNRVSEESLPDCLAYLAMALGRIDSVVRSLWALGVEHRSVISLQDSVPENCQATHVIVDLDGDNEDQKKTIRVTFDPSSALPFPSKVEVAMKNVGSSDYPISGWNALEDWRSSSRPWATGTLFQDIASTAAAS